MKQGKITLVGITHLACVITLAAACSATLGEDGNFSAVALDIQRDSRFVIFGVSVSQEEDVMAVRGRVRGA